MVNGSGTAGRSLLDGLIYPLIVLVTGFTLAAWLTPVLVPLWDGNARVPNVYDQSENAGRAHLEEAGFRNLTFHSDCSSSVAVGQIREVLVDNGAPIEDETSLVNKYVSGENTPVLEISKATPLVVKLGNGEACQQ
jgi:hypothetical protein